jgi:hypothetical protein
MAMEIHTLGDREQAPASTSNRTFGLVFGVFWTVVGMAPLVRHHPIRLWALILALGFGLTAILFPRGLTWLNRGWTKLGATIHAVVSPLALFIAYVVAVLPTAMILRIMGKDPLRRAIDRSVASYWISRGPQLPKESDMKNQF